MFHLQSRDSHFLNRHPLPALGRLGHCLQHCLPLGTVNKARLRHLILGYGLEQIANPVNKGVLVANDVPQRPPGLHIGMARLGGMAFMTGLREG